MAAYFFVDVREIKDPAQMQDYRSRINVVVENFGGRYVVIGGPFEVVEGSYQPVFPVMIQFPNIDDARRWYNSDEYCDLKALRLEATVSNAFLMEGPAPSR